MSVRKVKKVSKKTGRVLEGWQVDIDIELPTGKRARKRKLSMKWTRRNAESWETKARSALIDGTFGKEVPLFEAWFHGRFWTEWVIARNNKPGEKENKESIYRTHLHSAFGALSLDAITESEVAVFRSRLIEKLKHKTVNNILGVLSKALKFAERKHLIEFAPEVGLLRVEAPEIEVWDLAEYARYIDTAHTLDPTWYAAATLAGEAGLRVGEIKALEWERDVDMVARTITIQAQTRHGVTGTPKGRTRRTLPMTETLYEALRALNRIRRGYVICNEDGTPKSDNQCTKANYKICRRAALPARGWHVLRHTFATDAARFGASPWSLMKWLGHKAMKETLGYIDFAQDHARPAPDRVLHAGAGEADADRRVLKMLSARSILSGNLTATVLEVGA